MKVSKLIEALQRYSDKEVMIRIDNGLLCPIFEIKPIAESIVIDGKSPEIKNDSAENEDFKHLKFNESVETVYIIKQ